MRIDELAMVHYGAFSARVLDLREAPGLAVVYGPNEAGKSTCLAAALDFLFGIPHTSVHGGVFGYDKMRLDGSLRTADGAVLELRRRKGKSGKTLTSADGTARDEQVLAQAFGSFTRERYRALFALDHALLRSGGEALLRSSGEIGRLIVEAGGGLAHLLPLMAELDSEAEALYAPRAAKERVFYKALANLEAANKGIREGTLTRDAYEVAETHVGKLRERIAGLRAEQKAERARVAQAERLLRVQPLLLELARIDAALLREGDVPAPSPEWLAQVMQAIAYDSQVKTRLSAAETATRLAVEGVAAVLVDDTLLAQAPLLTALEERRKRLDVLREREAGLREELERARALLEQRAFGPLADGSADAGRVLRRALEGLQPRALALSQLREQARAAALRVSEDEAEADAARARREERSARGLDRPWQLDLGPLTELAPAIEHAARAAERLSADDARLSGALRALGVDHVDRLRAWLLPAADVVRDVVDAERRDAEVSRQRAEARVAAQRRAEVASTRLRELEAQGDVPRPERLARVRLARDEAWAAIRTDFLRVEPVYDDAHAFRARTANGAHFERLLHEADTVADALAAAAQHVAEARVLAREIEAAHAAHAVVMEAESAANTQQIARRTALFTGFEQLPAELAQPVPLLALIERRAQLLDEYADLSRRRAEYEAQHARIAPLTSLLTHAEATLELAPGDLSTTVRVASVLGRARAHEAAHAEHRRLEQEEATRAPARAQRAAHAALLTRERDDTQRAFVDDLVRFGLPSDTAPEQVTHFVKQLRDREAAEADAERLSAELAEIARAEAALTEALDTLRGLTIVVEGDVSCSAAAQVLQRRFAEAQTAAERRRTRDEIRTVAAAELHSAQAAARESAAELARLSDGAGVRVDELSAVVARAERVAAFENSRETLLVRVDQAGDGHAVAALRAELADRDVTLVRAEIPSFLASLKVHEDACDAALVELVHAEAELARFSGETSINQLHAAREAATTELGAAVERYLELRLTRSLLGRAVERVRAQQRDPLVSRAGELFALATEGAFLRIDTEVARDGEPVVFGVRHSGAAVPLHEMSDGTRDQLFLAFRLASVEHYCRVREPLPFIGDDLLVHFDDVRSRATLALMAELAKTTQVLLFTHHRSVCDAAQPLVASGLAQVVSLATPAPNPA